jgi:glycosyltransferase involved in cell wall biosynthesis
LAWAKEKVKKLPGAIRMAHQLRPVLARVVGDRWASLLINSPDTGDYRSVNQAAVEQRGMVSVIVSSFNAEAFLDLCLVSVAKQDYPHFECIIVDDGSTDGSPVIAKRWANRDPRFRVVAHRAHGGLSASRNTGLLNAVGEYVTFLDSNELMYQSALSKRMCLVVANESPETAGSYCGWDQQLESVSSVPACRSAPDLATVDFTSASGKCPFIASAPVVRRSLLIAAGGFDESAVQAEDGQLWSELLRNGYRFLPAKIIGLCSRPMPGSIRDEKRHAAGSTCVGNARVFDVLFFPHNDYHVWTASSIINSLNSAGLSSACVDLTYAYGEQGASASLREHEIDSITINDYLMIRTPPKAVVCFNDWDTRVVRPVIERCNVEGIPTIGVVEGAQDFDDSDTGRIRRPYRSVRHVFLTGRYDRKFFRSGEQRLYEVGVPRIEELLQEPVRRPASSLVVVNQNFTYGVLTDEAGKWLESVVRACGLADLPYLVSQHPADPTDLDGYNTSGLDMYELIRCGSVFVSRFSSGILESLALGKPVVYHNPHGEQVDKFQDGMGVYRMTESVKELTEELIRLKEWNPSIRDEARDFLDRHCNTANHTPAAATAAQHIRQIIGA